VITSGGRLAAKYVIHTVGPIFRDGRRGEAVTLASCHRECIRVAEEHGLRSVAFPAISTGAYGYPVHEAAPIAISSVMDALIAAKRVEKCRFVLFDISTLRAYERAAEKLTTTNASMKIEKTHS
jgi:O-acetyl-ADP-ribose deacetylase